MHIDPLPLEFFVDALHTGFPFTFSRWGDGEWHGILGTDLRENCDGHPYTLDLCADLREVLDNQKPYYHGLMQNAIDEHGDKVEKYLFEHQVLIPWYTGDTFVKAHLDGELLPLIRELKRRTILYVGPKHLRAISEKIFPTKWYLEIPRYNAYSMKWEIMHALDSLIELSHPDVVAISAGFLSKILIDNLWDQADNEFTVIDFGSLWDGYVGTISRKWHKTKRQDELVKINLGKR